MLRMCHWLTSVRQAFICLSRIFSKRHMSFHNLVFCYLLLTLPITQLTSNCFLIKKIFIRHPPCVTRHSRDRNAVVSTGDNALGLLGLLLNTSVEPSLPCGLDHSSSRTLTHTAFCPDLYWNQLLQCIATPVFQGSAVYTGGPQNWTLSAPGSSFVEDVGGWGEHNRR